MFLLPIRFIELKRVLLVVDYDQAEQFVNMALTVANKGLIFNLWTD